MRRIEHEKHLDYIMAKSKKTQENWQKIMQAKGSFSDFKSKKFMPIEPDTTSSKPTKQTKGKDTATINIQTKKIVEAFDDEVFN